MKKINFSKLTLGLIILALGITALFSFNFNRTNILAETSVPDYFTVKHYTTYSDTDPSVNVVYNQLTNGQVAYVRNGHTVEAKMYIDETPSPIKHISPYILINGQNYGNQELLDMGIVVNYSTSLFSVTSKINNNSNPYGKYELQIDYIIYENSVDVNKSLNFVYYVLPETNYYNGTNVQVSFDNAYSVNAPTFDRGYSYQYQYISSENNINSNSLPTLTYNKKNFALSITKTFQKSDASQNIWFNGTSIETDNNLVYVVEDDETDYVKIYFNDLGMYSIKYNFTYVYGDNIIETIAPSSLNTVKRNDCLEIFGYQAYYSDITTSTIKEFKNINNGIIGNEITDITYLTNNSYNTSLDNTEQTNLTNILDLLNNSSLKIQKTNQSPIQFSYNVEIFNNENSTITDTQSGYWKIIESNENGYSLEVDDEGNSIKYDYDNRPFAETGIYLVKLVYKNHSLISGTNAEENCLASSISDTETEKLRCQWFIFKTTKETTEMSIKDINNVNLLDEAYTNQDVIISKTGLASIFDAKTELNVYRQSDYTGQYELVSTVEANNDLTVSDNGNYIVTMFFGKNLTRSYSSTFTIDKTEIENVQIFTTSKIDGNYYYRNNEIDFLTNEPVIVSWNEKHSGSKISAQYKYIPIVKDTNTNFTSTILKEYYNYGMVPVEYYFDYQNTELNSVNYYNSQNYNYIPSSNVLTEPGMYIFRLEDTAGNEKYFTFVIDNTENKILQQVDGEFVEPTSLNILSSDVTIAWGQYKVIKFNGLNYSSGSFDINDQWLETILNNTDLYQKYFELKSINTVSTFLTKSEINQNVLLTINGETRFIAPEEIVNYSYFIPFTVTEDNTVTANENDYVFYTRDSSNTKTIVGLNEVSIENYLTNFSGMHNLRMSSDSSRTTLVYTKNNELTTLQTDSYTPSAHADLNGLKYLQKDKYFIPTNINTLKDSQEILTLNFNAMPEEGVLEVLSVSYTYAPFSVKTYSDTQKTSYTYAFETPQEEVVIYSKNNPLENLCTLKTDEDGNTYYSWDINKEYVYSNQEGIYRTKAGKYTITRIYDKLTDTESKVNDTYDYMIRTLTFVVDRNGIITSPTIVDTAGTTFNYVGESIKLQVLEEENKMFFNDIFVASNDPYGDNVILSTNKLPVFVYVPVQKYGYSLGDGERFYEEESIIYWTNTNKADSKISAYSLSAEIKYSYEKSTLDQSNIIYRSSAELSTDGYLKFNDSQSGRAFTQVGYYKVTISQGYTGYGDINKFSFIFEITEEEPEFIITNTATDEEFEQFNNVYYTNKESVRLTWLDSENNFKATINKSAITYSINGQEPVVINEKDVQTLNKVNYVDINLKEIGAYLHNTQITFSMQFEGKESHYNTGKFKTTRTLVVDTIAPTSNINKLVSLSGINEALVRNVEAKYNTSVSSGLYKYYSYVLDVSNISSVLDLTSQTNGEAYKILYRFFETTIEDRTVYTKYNDIYQQESLPNMIENSSYSFETLDEQTLAEIIQNLSFHYRPYIEIVEMDMAGNITIYTIYLTNLQSLSETNNTPIVYKNNGTSKYIYYSNLAPSIDIYAKSSLEITDINMMDFDWNKITINNTTYLKTPYLKDKYYNLSTYDENNPSKSEVSLTEFASLYPSSAKQTIQLELVPYFNNITLTCSVLNTSLSIIHTSATSNYSNEEGVLIKIPSNSSVLDATIHASSVEIIQFIKNNDGSYTQDALYLNQNKDYFASVSTEPDNTSFISTSYVNYLGSTYIKIIVKSPVNNRFYKYNIIDNFSDVYPITNIYGSEIIEKELYSEVALVENYEDGIKNYYSTKDIYFKYNTAKDKVVLSVTGYTPFDLSNPDDVTRFKNENIGNILEPVGNSVIYTLILYAPRLNMAEGIVGGELHFKLEIYEAIENINNGLPYNTLNLVIYNIVPHITLLDELNNSQNGLFNKDTMYGNQIKISFKETVGKIPCIIYLEYEDGFIEQISSGKIISEPSIYTIIIKYTEIFTDDQYNTYLDFTISDNDKDFYQVVYKNGDTSYVANATGNLFSYTENNITYSVSTHYILNTSEFDIICNTEQDVTVEPPSTIVVNSYTSYIYKITNVGSQTATKYFTRTIAITVIPKSESILSKYSYFTNEGTRTDFDLTKTQESFVISTEENNASYKKIAWQSYYGIPENLVTVKIYFGDNQTEYTPNLTIENNLTTLTLTTSGTYYLTFSDIAGNVHKFNSLSSTYTIRYLRNVIYTVNDESPINNAVYDKQVVIKIPTSTISYYDSNAQPKISVLRNGETYQPDIDSSNKIFTFTEAGLYKVWFSASVTENGQVKDVNEEPLYFLIIRPNESRWAFEFSEYSNYYVETIVKDNKDVTESLTNQNMGKLTYKTMYNEDGTSYQKPYLKSFLISVNDALTGNGHYTITINTDNEFAQKFTFSFWINKKDAPIFVSVKEDTETTSPITISFNTSDLIEEVGDCILRVNGYNDLVLTSEKLSNGELLNSYNIVLEDADTYFIQLFSESGKLLYSYRVVKNAPLNAISIILIVVACLVFVGLSIMFTLLRKRMKIR